MLSEPLLITYDGVQSSYARVSYGNPSTGEPSTFVTSDGQFQCFITETEREDSVVFEVSLERVEQDADGNPFTGSWSRLPNRVGFVFEVNKLRYNTSTDLPLLQSALQSLVDGPFRNRIINGEK